jgi:hypothetical protein
VSIAGFPVHDWQFWAATAVFVFAAAWLLRGVLPVPVLTRRHERKKHERGVRLTVKGKPVSKHEPGMK